VSVPAGFVGDRSGPQGEAGRARRVGGTPGAAPGAGPRRRGGGRKHAAGAGGDALASPMQGTIVKIAVAEGDTVAEGDLVVVLEAMKMEQPLNAHKAGVV